MAFKFNAMKPTKEMLTKLYLEQNLTQLQIAKRYAVSATTVAYWLKKLEVPKKPKKTYMGMIRLSDDVLTKLTAIARERGTDNTKVIEELIRNA